MTYSKLKNLFTEHKDRKFTFIVQGGNQGDQMIWAGARKLAHLAELNYRETNMKRGHSPYIDIKPDEILYLNGGGGFNTWWNWTPRLLNRLVKQYPENMIVVGPSTVALQGWYLDKWLPCSDNVIFYARELTTYNFLKENYDLNLFHDQDTALHLNVDDAEFKKLMGDNYSENRHTLFGLREDPESLDNIPSQVNLEDYDLVVDPCLEKNWAQLHLHASKILTNRCHSAILGSILGKDTTMFNGNYHKNRSIWEYSLKKRGVKWI